MVDAILTAFLLIMIALFFGDLIRIPLEYFLRSVFEEKPWNEHGTPVPASGSNWVERVRFARKQRLHPKRRHMLS